MSLNGKVVVVTGASSGIGAVLSAKLVESGARVFGVSRRETELKKLQNELGSSFSYSIADVGSWPDVSRAASEIFEKAGKIDALVNNAGFGIFKPVDQLSIEEWNSQIQTNLTGAFYFSKAVIPELKKQGGGSIINIASIAGLQAIPNASAYNASKFGMVGLSESMMLELRPYGIRVTSICPGSVDTPFFNDVPENLVSSYKLTPENIADSVIYVLNQPEHLVVDKIVLRPAGKRI
ncbi:MAG: SDR family NAD(P)-dependent oxidoreductase [Bacteroidetes bacterium]|nr:SDR family NAD(P)-dependent oxidoreductase [Bacteroidota bacterium]